MSIRLIVKHSSIPSRRLSAARVAGCLGTACKLVVATHHVELSHSQVRTVLNCQCQSDEPWPEVLCRRVISQARLVEIYDAFVNEVIQAADRNIARSDPNQLNFSGGERTFYTIRVLWNCLKRAEAKAPGLSLALQAFPCRSASSSRISPASSWVSASFNHRSPNGLHALLDCRT